MIIDTDNLKSSVDQQEESQGQATAGYTGVRNSDGTPKGIYNAILVGLMPLADEMVDIAVGNRKSFSSANNFAIKEGWEFLKNALKAVDSAVQIPGLSEGPISQRVDLVLARVASGHLTLTEGKRLIEMLQAGFEITDLQALMAKMDNINLSQT